MTPDKFIAKWQRTTTSERAASQEHFIDLCQLLDQPTPHEIDPDGRFYAFERGAARTGMATGGWADVWKRGHFGWEYKRRSGGRSTTLAKALQQLQLYALALESPPLLVVSDIDVIQIHTAFQNAVQQVHTIRIEELAQPETRRLLSWVFHAPERLRPKATRDQATAAAAVRFAGLADQLRARGHEPEKVAHFLNRLLFCMYAEDAGLLREKLFTELLERASQVPRDGDDLVARLFSVMRSGGTFGLERVHRFNGGLFDSDETVPLLRDEFLELAELARMDWSQIEPALFGTLFERGLDPSKRAQLGAHYTDAGSIYRIVNVVVTAPLEAEWLGIVPRITLSIKRMERASTKATTDKNRAQAMTLYVGFIERLRTFRVLDPACGSGNFLYISLRALKDLEHRVNLEAEALGLDRQQPTVGPANVCGIEINSVAAELARVTVWIGEIQWMLDHGYALDTNPVLRPLENITCTDALVGPDGRPTTWPEVQAIVGNPPFLGVRRMIRNLGEQYTTMLRSTYANRGVSGTDLVTFWFERVREAFAHTALERAGLVSTNSVRDGANRAVLDHLVESATLEAVWSDEPWVNEGAAVRVSIVCAARPEFAVSPVLNGERVESIRTDLSATSASDEDRDPKRAPIQIANADYATQGPVKAGAFEIEGDLARAMLASPNAHGNDNEAVLRPWLHGNDVTGRPDDMWIIDFDGVDTEQAAARFEAPYQHVLEHVYDKRQRQRDSSRKRFWWRHGRAGTDFRSQTKTLERYIATLRVSTHRIFVWADARAFPDSRVLAIASEAHSVFGVLHSSVHEAWTLATCSWHGQGNDPTYNKGTCFERFAFPDAVPLVRSDVGASLEAARIAEAARELEQTRRRWLHPPQWCDHPDTGEPGHGVCRPYSGYEHDLTARTPTNLYNNRPPWLVHLHDSLNQAVLAAYGWHDDPTSSEIVNRLVALANERHLAHAR